MAAIKNSVVKTCSRCGYPTSIDNFLQTKSLLYQDGRVPICNDCLKKFSNQVKDDWAKINKMCQWLDIPFIPDQYQKVYNSNPNDAFLTYARIFRSKAYENLDWTTYYQEFKKLEKENELRAQLPLFEESRIRELQQVWGENYSPEQLSYLQNLLDGIMKTQNVNGELQYDQAKKLCKISLNIEERISADAEFDKLLASYEKLVKAAEFTPKNDLLILKSVDLSLLIVLMSQRILLIRQLLISRIFAKNCILMNLPWVKKLARELNHFKERKKLRIIMAYGAPAKFQMIMMLS